MTGPPPHLALLPCAGMGHLLPFLRLAAMLASRGCLITFISPQPTVSAAESNQLSAFLDAYPNIKHLEFKLLPHKKSNFTNEDPFFIQIEAIDNSVHLLSPLLSSLSPPLSAIVADFPVTSSITQVASDLSVPAYIVVTTSARFFSVIAHLPQVAQENSIKEKGCIEIPGLDPVPLSSIPPPMLNPDHFFGANVISSASSLFRAKGILINTFRSFETEAIEALSRSGASAPILPLGPFESFEIGEARNFPWLDEQAQESVIFISFGSRTALSKDQTRELANGIEKSGCKFLWALKTSKVDKEDNQELEQILGESFLERTKKQGMVVKGWVNQEQVLAHPAIGGFVSHCGWNSVLEAARLGVPVLAWPQNGDQRVNAEVVEKVGLGLWVRAWNWGGEKLVHGDEIAEKIMEVMGEQKLKDRAKELKEKARQAREVDGSSERLLRGLIEALKGKDES